MKRYLIIPGKILLLIICCTAILGFINYEVYSLNRKEYARQTDIANETHEQIRLNLNLIKIAIQTNNIEQYNDNLSKLRENSAKIEPLFFIKDEQESYLTSLHSYIELLENRKTLLPEIANIKKDVSNIEKTFKDNYGDKDAISREKLTSLSAEVEKLILDEKKYSEESILAVVSAINETLNDIISESKALADCIDNCYKDRIAEINDELAGKLEAFSKKIEGLNQTIEDQFDLKTLDELKEL